MKRLHTSSRKEKGVTEMSLSRIIFLLTLYLYAEFLRVGEKIASSVAELLRSAMSIRVLSWQCGPRRQWDGLFLLEIKPLFKWSRPRPHVLLNFRALICVVAVSFTGEMNFVVENAYFTNLNHFTKYRDIWNIDTWETFHDLLIPYELTSKVTSWYISPNNKCMAEKFSDQLKPTQAWLAREESVYFICHSIDDSLKFGMC